MAKKFMMTAVFAANTKERCMMNDVMYPCTNCTRVCNPAECDNKRCGPWRNWFIRRWEKLRRQLTK